MRPAFSTLVILSCWPAYSANTRLAAAKADLQQIAVDPSETWRVRDLELALGGAKVYLSEGVLAFATPVAGNRVAAVFTTSQVEGGDAEVIALPPTSAERASLAHFTHSPNVDEHFSSALLYFSGDKAVELLRQIHEHPLHPAPELAPEIASSFGESLHKGANEIDVRVIESALDRHAPKDGFFYAMMAGRSAGLFDLLLQPDQPDQLLLGRLADTAEGAHVRQYFQIWSAFPARNQPEPPPPLYRLTDYRIDTTIHDDLSLSATANFDYLASPSDGPTVPLLITSRLHVTWAEIDGRPADVLSHESALTMDEHGASTFLLVNDADLTPGSHHRIAVHYAGTVIRLTSNGAYFVDDRSAWYPFTGSMLTVFDLTFHCPESLRLVASGDPVSEEVKQGQRTVHRRMTAPHSLAGFNLGRFDVAVSEQSPNRIEICSNRSAAPAPDLARQTGSILDYFSRRWMPLSNRTLAITPIEGYFGQGFPGLIYLSSVSYLREHDRPKGLRTAVLDAFFSKLLLPHELAHQWWGNVATPAGYRAMWIVEAMANYSALQYLEHTEGRAVFDDILAEYRLDLITPRADGELVDANGPVTFGQRLENNFGTGVWHDILYEKGTWIFHMLRERMGDASFHNFQLKLLKDYAARPISNEELRQEAVQFIPPGEPDRRLLGFFDTWVYGTGIPQLSLHGNTIRTSLVPESYTADLPLRCGSSGESTVWVRVVTGETTVPVRNCRLPAAGKFLFRD